MNNEPKVTLKLDKRGRLCAWHGNVQSRIENGDDRNLLVRGEPALCRLEGHDRTLVESKLPANVVRLLSENYSVVLTRKECFL